MTNPAPRGTRTKRFSTLVVLALVSSMLGGCIIAPYPYEGHYYGHHYYWGGHY